MAEGERITARQRAILTAIVENYIETGEPVGSGTIAGTIARVQAAGGQGGGLSPATVRNEMAELANAGLLEQPHTSAGRVPTAQAEDRFQGSSTSVFPTFAATDSPPAHPCRRRSPLSCFSRRKPASSRPETPL